MSYYILPKNTNILDLNPIYSDTINPTYNSFSLLNYYFELKNEINNFLMNDIDSSNVLYENIIKLINPYEYLFTKVSGTSYSVSKFKNKNNLFYDLYEIINSLNLFGSFNLTSIHSVHISKNCIDSIECNDLLRESSNDNNVHYDNIDNINIDVNLKFDYIFYEIDNVHYIKSFIKILRFILKTQNNNGITIIKIADLFDKPTLDVLYYLSSIYEKVYICKPNSSNITTFDKYIICKNFKYEFNDNEYLIKNYNKLTEAINNSENKYITEILNFAIPCYFKNKVEDINIILGQQQLESLDNLLSIFRNKNRNDKIETIKKNNILKSIAWCEKYGVPCNKFIDKTNIFLPLADESL